MLRNAVKRLNEQIEGHEMLEALVSLAAGLFLIAEIFLILLMLEA